MLHFSFFILEPDDDESVGSYSINKVTESVISIAGVALPLLNNADKDKVFVFSVHLVFYCF